MAKQTVVTLIDDIDGSEATESISFSYRGVTYSIDLNEKNAAAFDKAISKYLDKARGSPVVDKVHDLGPCHPRVAGPTWAISAPWAAEHGYDVSSRGRIAAEVLEAYDSAR